MTSDCQRVFDEWVTTYGRSECQRVISKFNRARLERGDTARPSRIKFKWSLVKKLYNRQRGVCPRCRKDMALDRAKIHVDHFSPAAADFNAESNLRVLHSTCNLSKNANSIYDEAKTLNRTVTDMVEEQNEIHREEIEDEI